MSLFWNSTKGKELKEVTAYEYKGGLYKDKASFEAEERTNRVHYAKREIAKMFDCNHTGSHFHNAINIADIILNRWNHISLLVREIDERI